jgi:rhamnosyltransferase
VTHRPDPTRLGEVLTAIAAQVRDVVVVDNASPRQDAIVDLSARHGANILPQSTNVGLAAAQNLGIEWARRADAEFVVILDQDSIASPDMVTRLLGGLERASGSARVAAVGPRFHEPRDGRDYPFIRVRFPRSEKLWCDVAAADIETDFLISSGSLIPVAVLDDIGDLDDGLFIDNVDLEWSFRARARGYVLIGVCSAAMEHQLGERRTRLLGYEQVVHSPTRLYYIMRNRVLLYRRRSTPRTWVAQDLLRLPVKFFIFSVLVAPRARNARFMLRGLWDAARNRTGPCPLVEA